MQQDSAPAPPSQDSQKQISRFAEADETPFQVLKTKVYPIINSVILKLIDHIVQSHQVQKHEERLQKKKLIDQLERKYLERDIEKEQMGSDYEESDDQQFHRKLEMKKEEVEKLVRSRIQAHKINPTAVDKQFDKNAFNPIAFIIKELKEIHRGESEPKSQKKQQTKI